jgi:hypothetical protein
MLVGQHDTAHPHRIVGKRKSCQKVSAAESA